MMHGNSFGNGFGSGFCPLWNGYAGFSIWHGVMMLGVLVVIVGILLMFKGRKSNNNTALELLKIQYVNGNITEKEYLDRKDVLGRK